MDLERDGGQRFPNVLSMPDVEAFRLAVKASDLGRAGERLVSVDGLTGWIGPQSPVGRIVAELMGVEARPVRAILFDKNAAANWALGWHQDRTIAVAARVDMAGFRNWNRKNGVDHVEPPFEFFERMLTARIHLDAVPDDNAPLLISPGTHRLGPIPESGTGEIVERHGIVQCLAEAGDVWLYRTSILHASKRSVAPHRRRVVQVDFSADTLPHPLRWSLDGC